ncbi:hypothetical protein EYF80_012284 [Liparis tanakae]|uniref:Uncharacterized protein n=1 Tax=Liparis tanakae TaxID=230148 RepID=A0A4Z2IHL5_9TELE|nr:hypothetical protein EYF80_012284 [Liparis tanakae]
MNQLQLKCSGGCEDVREVRASHEHSGHELPVARTDPPKPEEPLGSPSTDEGGSKPRVSRGHAPHESSTSRWKAGAYPSPALYAGKQEGPEEKQVERLQSGLQRRGQSCRSLPGVRSCEVGWGGDVSVHDVTGVGFPLEAERGGLCWRACLRGMLPSAALHNAHLAGGCAVPGGEVHDNEVITTHVCGRADAAVSRGAADCRGSGPCQAPWVTSPQSLDQAAAEPEAKPPATGDVTLPEKQGQHPAAPPSSFSSQMTSAGTQLQQLCSGWTAALKWKIEPDDQVMTKCSQNRVDAACECSNMVPQTTESREDNAKGGCLSSAEQEDQD